MIRRIAGYNQVATTPTDQMGAPPEPIKSKMANPPEPVQTQADGSVAPQHQQNALQRAGEQRIQASLLQAELLRKLGSPPDNGLTFGADGETGPGDEKAIKLAVDAFVLTDSERLMNTTNQTAELKAKGLFGSDGGVETTMPNLQNKLK